MLTRLQDRIDSGPDGEEVIVRYGMWGTNIEIERRGRTFYVVLPKKKEVKFKTLAEAEAYLKALVKYR